VTLFCLLGSSGGWLTAAACRPRTAPPTPDARPGANGLLRVTFLDVGQGDGCVIESPTGKIVVVDGGGHPDTDERGGNDPGARVIVPFLRSRGVSAVDLIIATHPHDDHVQGLIAVTERLRVRQALDGGFPGGPGSPIYRRWRDALRRRGVPLVVPRRGQVITLGGGARLEILGPPPRVLGGHSPENNHSVVLRLVYGRARLLFTGDAESEAETDLLASGTDISADLLKIGHHGSRWSSTDAFLDRVTPTLAVISCGRRNGFNHPHPETLERLSHRGVRVFRTDRQGAITVESDGRRLRVTPTLAPAPQTAP